MKFESAASRSLPEASLLADLSSAVAAAALNAAFEGYLVPMALSSVQFEARFRAENVDPFASYVWLSADEPAAILLIARRGWSARIAAIGVAKPWRGTGLSAEVMTRAVAEAQGRGDRILVLEVFERNEVALKLYHRFDFRAARSLRGFSIRSVGATPSPAELLAEIDPAEGAARMQAFERRDVDRSLLP